jgi:RNA polymerase primary sigma factor
MTDREELIERGKDEGHPNHDEAKQYLPAGLISGEKPDDVMSMFGDMDIEIIDSAQRVKLPQRREKDHDEEEEKEDQKLDMLTLGKTNDPVRLYLREMGMVSLLTREGEVEIAKRSKKANVRLEKRPFIPLRL